MLLIVYLFLLSLVYFYFKEIKHKKNIKDVMWVFNFCFLLVMYIVFGVWKIKESGLETIIGLVFQAIYITFRSMAFAKEFLYYEDIFYLLGPENSVMLQVWLIVLLSSFYTAQFFIVTFLESQINMIKMRIRLYFQKEIIFVAGDKNNVLELIRSFRMSHKKSIIIWFVDENTMGKLSILENIMLRPLDNLESWLASSEVNKSKFYRGVFIFDSGDINVSLLSLVHNLSPNKEELNNNLQLTVLCDNEHLRFSRWETNLDVYFVSRPNLVARNVMTNHPILDVLDRNEKLGYHKDGFAFVKKDISIAVLGFGELGMEMLLMAYENSRFLREDNAENTFCVDVFFEKSNGVNHVYTDKLGFFASKVNFNLVEGPLRSQRTMDVIKENLKKYEIIYLTSDIDEDNIKMALSLIQYMELENLNYSPQFVICVKGTTTYNEDLNTLIYTEYKHISLVNISKNVFSNESLILKEDEIKSREYHKRYELLNSHEKVKIESDSYRKLDTFLKASNLAAVYDEEIKRRLVKRCTTADYDNELLYEKLAMYEHYRWCAFHIARGWRNLLPDELSSHEVNDNVTKRIKEKKHLCLVPWEELPSINANNSRNRFQKYNINEAKTFLYNLKQRGHYCGNKSRVY